jgi:N-acetylmuramoyl-L-alanine amidase
MRTLAWFVILLAQLPGAFGSSLPTRLSRTWFLGSEYVRVDDWARTSGFQVQWITWKEELKLSSASTTIVFNVDSRRILLNGVSIWLSTPIAFKNNAAYIAPLDLYTSLNPILFPGKYPPGKQVKTICLDPGHGGKDPGNKEGREQEKKYTLLLAQELKATLTKAGFQVVLTRSGDTYPELNDRPEFARKRGADVFLSLHFNSADSAAAKSVQGVEVYCLTPTHAASTNVRGATTDTGASAGNRLDAKNALLAFQIQRAIVRTVGAEDRGVRRARFVVLRLAEMPAVLVEAGFMTHPTESKKIYSAAYRQQMAQAITTGLLAYKKSVEQPQ